jgi:molybdate transport system substrate-binding protein
VARKAAAILVLALGACGSGRSGPVSPVVRVLAAASLADVLPPIARELEASEHVTVELQFGASSTLAAQIRSGAPCDAFVAADPRWTQLLVDERLADAATRRVIATNRLVAIVPADADSPPSTLAELAALPHVAVAGPEVPAGAHARTALDRGGVLAAAEPHFVSATDVRAALAWVARGEAEAGLVYATDARVEPRVRVAFELGPEAHDPIRYQAIAVARDPGAPSSERGRTFVDHLASPSARAALERAGFDAPD